MRSYTRAALLGLILAGGGVATTGCGGGEHYRNLVDICEYDRHNAQARQEDIMCFNPQVQNGRVLDQTVWNYDFEPGTDKLNPTGQDKLLQIVRRRPAPDFRVFLATTRDLNYDSAHPEQFAEEARELDAKRVVAIQKYLGAVTAGRPMAFQIDVHDPNPEIGLYAVQGLKALSSLNNGFVGQAAPPGSGPTQAGGGVAAAGQQVPPGQPAATGAVPGTPAPPPAGGPATGPGGTSP